MGGGGAAERAIPERTVTESKPPRHLVTVWNPSYAQDAMDEHLAVLIDWAGRAQAGEAEDKEVYVWWGKIRSPNRKGLLPHADAVTALDEQVRAGTETHLYLTDYRSLYVAWVGEITAEHLPREQPEELDHMPSYYRDQFADFWFQLWDIRRLVADDTPAVIEELKRLRNTRYHDRPVSLYGGMVELPLIVTREDGASWFSDRDVLTDGQLWAQREGELPHCLRRITGIRNPAAHILASTREGVSMGRSEVLGIGCEGLVVRLARVRLRVG